MLCLKTSSILLFIHQSGATFQAMTHFMIWCHSWGGVLELKCFMWGQVSGTGCFKFYIVWQGCLLDMPYHKYHLPLISGPPGPVWSPLKFISKGLQGGLSFNRRDLATGEGSDRDEPIQTRINNYRIPVAQWAESRQHFSLSRGMRDIGLAPRVKKDAAERWHTFIFA